LMGNCEDVEEEESLLQANGLKWEFLLIECPIVLQ